jgi:hypothetical protein
MMTGQPPVHLRIEDRRNERELTVARTRRKKTTSGLNAAKLARALSPPNKKQFCAAAQVGRRTRQLICFDKSEVGAKRIAGRFYREMYPDRTVTILAVDKL